MRPLRASSGTIYDLDRAPAIVDGTFNDGPQDAVAVAVAARILPVRQVVAPSPRQARLAMFLLRQLKRGGVLVAAGSELDDRSGPWISYNLVPKYLEAEPCSVIDAVLWAARDQHRALQWVLLGPATHLAEAIDKRPDLIGRLAVTWLVGTSDPDQPRLPASNIRADPAAAVKVLRSGVDLTLLSADTPLAVGASSRMYRAMCGEKGPRWVQSVRGCVDERLADHQLLGLHSALTVTVAAGMPFAAFENYRFTVEDDGRVERDPAGAYTARMPTEIDTEMLSRWLACFFTKFAQASSGFDPELRSAGQGVEESS